MIGNERLPNFLVIGVQRSATSWIYQCLKGHPDIFLPFIKEINFFDKYYSKGIDWYKRFYDLHKSEKAVGDVTPSYLFRGQSHARIASHLPDVRLIVCLRNPIERAFSQYRKQIKSGRISMSFEEGLKEIPVFTEKGFYYSQITRLLEFFPREKLLVLIYEDIEKDPVKFMQDIFSFLEVDPKHVPPVVFDKVTPDMLGQFRLYKSILGISTLFRSLGLGKAIDAVKRSRLRLITDSLLHRNSFKVKQRMSRPEEGASETIAPQTRERLAGIFYEENQRLSRFLNRDLGFWV